MKDHEYLIEGKRLERKIHIELCPENKKGKKTVALMVRDVGGSVKVDA